MEDKSAHNSISDITKPSAITPGGSPAYPDTRVNDNARNPDGQNDTMKGCACDAWQPSMMNVDRQMKIDPFSEIGAKKFEH